MKQYDIKLRTFEFALDNLKMCKEIAENHKEYILTKQLIRSSTSVGANVREAKNAVSKKDFVFKLGIAQKECDESIYWLELLKAFLNEDIKELDANLIEARELMKIISVILVKIKANMS